MEITTHSSNNIKVLSLKGEMNANTAGEAETKLNQLIMGGNKKLVINLENLDYISSAGLRILLMANKLIKKKEGTLRICCLNNTVKEVFEISGFHMIFSIFDNEQEAIADY